jgi:hypothetical protein
VPTSGFLTQLDATTNKKILPEVSDGVFMNDPLLAYWKSNSLERYSGQALQTGLSYNRLPSDWIAKGGNVDITQPQILNGFTFQPKTSEVSVSVFLEDTEVDNAGPEAVIRDVAARLQTAALTMSEKLAIAQWRHGQALAGDDRSLFMHGLAEALNDGVNAGWDGNIFPNYGTVPRASLRTGQAVGLGPADARVAVTGDVAANLSGAISYDILERTFNSVVIGPERPDLICTTNLGMSYIKRKFQPQQRFEEKSKIAIGFSALSFNGAEIMQSQYCPGSQGQALSTGTTGPGSFALSTGETMWFLNTKQFRFWLANSNLFAFGFTGWKPAQDNLTIAGQYLYRGPGITCKMPRYSRYLYNVTG